MARERRERSTVVERHDALPQWTRYSRIWRVSTGHCCRSFVLLLLLLLRRRCRSFVSDSEGTGRYSTSEGAAPLIRTAVDVSIAAAVVLLISADSLGDIDRLLLSIWLELLLLLFKGENGELIALGLVVDTVRFRDSIAVPFDCVRAEGDGAEGK